MTQGPLEYTFHLPESDSHHVVLGFMKEMASAGTKTENLFNFQQFNVGEIGLQFYDEKFHLLTNFMSGKVVRAYKQLYVDTGLQVKGIHCSVTLADFMDGYSLFAFDLTPNRTPKDARINLLCQGKLNLNLWNCTAPSSLRHHLCCV